MSSTVMIVLCPLRGIGHFALREDSYGELNFLTVPTAGDDELDLASKALSHYFDLENPDNVIRGVRPLGTLNYEYSEIIVNVVVVSSGFKKSEPQGIKWVSEGELSGLIANGAFRGVTSVASHGLFSVNRGGFGSLII